MRIKKNKKKYNKGFTLIEIILAAAIIIFLSATMFKIISVSDTHRGLILKAEEVKSAMRLAQTYALSIPPDHSSRVVCGYGVRRVGTSSNYALEVYYLYNSNYASSPDWCGTRTYVSSRVVPLFRVDLAGYTVPSTRVFFQVPYGKVYAGGWLSGSNTRSYNIRKGGATKTISITAGGKIDI
jgi:prepilin-type N-terminal cleavage/methylation domain-containing protein